MKNEAKIEQIMNLLDVPTKPSEIAARMGCSQDEVQALLQLLAERGAAKPCKDGKKGNVSWISSDAVIRQQCRWTEQQVLEELAQQPLQLWRLGALSKTPRTAMRLLMERMERAGTVKRISIVGTGRCWALSTHKVLKPGEASKGRTVLLSELRRYIQKHQPAKLQSMVEHFGRGPVYLRGRMTLLREKGVVKHDVLGGSYRYVMADYQRPVEELRAEIMRRCEEDEEGCLRWEGAHTPDGHPLMRHDGSPKRVDVILWTVVSGKRIKQGHTLTETCGMRGCCDPAHHKQVTRGEAVKKRMQAIGFGGPKHGARVSAALRKSRPGLLTPEELEYVRTSPKTGREVAKELGRLPSVISGVRRGDNYRDYSQLTKPATPFAGLGARR